MNFRTDLALEQREALAQADCRGVLSSERTIGGVRVTTVNVLNETGEQAIGKPVGKYVTLELEGMMKPLDALEDLQALLADTIRSMLPQQGLVLVVGLGNEQITPDALGPRAINHIFATRHISKALSAHIGLGALRAVAAVAPGVLGQTGVETAEILHALVRQLFPDALIVIDALAARNLSRVGTTIQLADSGISPGSGVGNRRAEISRRTLGVPVVALGVPTVVDAETLAFDLTHEKGNENEQPHPQARQMMVTPKEIDLLIDRAAQLLAAAVNRALQPSLSAQELRLLTQ